MKIIESLSLPEEVRKIKPFSIVFREGINLIVGENGSGKSTLFKMMTDKGFCAREIKMAKGKGTAQYRFLDTERDNPRVQSSLRHAPAETFMFQVSSHFRSHGETMFPLIKAIADFSDTPVFVDEPESGLSLKHQRQLVTAFRKAAKQGNQLFIATHSYPIIRSEKEVFSMDELKWVKSADYLDKVLGKKR